MIRVLRAKLHGIRVTGAELDYHGSITLDPEHCALAGICPMEFVDIWNKSSAARISTYVIFGVPGSNCCVLNGAAARTCQVGDELIVAASDYIGRGDLLTRRATILTFNADNSVLEQLEYVVAMGADGKYRFDIVPAAAPRAWRQDRLPEYALLNELGEGP